MTQEKQLNEIIELLKAQNSLLLAQIRKQDITSREIALLKYGEGYPKKWSESPF